MEFLTSRPNISWRKSHPKKVWAHCAPTPIGLKQIYVENSFHLATKFTQTMLWGATIRFSIFGIQIVEPK